MIPPKRSLAQSQTRRSQSRQRQSCGLAFAIALLVALPAIAEELPSHPDQLRYPELDFEVPRAEQYRHRLESGVVVYVVEEHILPLVSVGVVVRVGSFLEPASKVGLASLTGAMLRRGGTADLAPGDFDERADMLAADLDASVGDTSGGAGLNCLTNVLDECLELFFAMLTEPRFDAERLALEKDNLLERLKQRNDDPGRLARREWQWLMYGQEHFASRLVTGDSLAAIEREDLVAFHRSYWRPQNMIVRVSGDVDTESILQRLEQHFADWPAGEPEEVPWPPPPPRHRPEPGVYSLAKDIPQGRVQMGHLAIQRDGWDDPRGPALALMNEILGGGGFTSRLTQRIRSDEGLAYDAGSSYGVGTHWPGTFTIFYQSKSETVAYAAKIAFEELRRIRQEPVSDQELATAKASFIETFPRSFESARAVAALFAEDEYLGRPHSYWYDYRERVARVTKEDVQRVARDFLDPEAAVFLVIGDWEAIAKGDADGKASMEELFGSAVTHLPRRDPVSLEPVANR